MSDNNADFDLWWEDNEEKVTMDFKRIIEEEMLSYKAELLNNEYADYQGNWDEEWEALKCSMIPQDEGPGATINEYIDKVAHDDWYDQEAFIVLEELFLFLASDY